jgi:hypothetical protein
VDMLTAQVPLISAFHCGIHKANIF